MAESLTFVTRTGPETAGLFDHLAGLRIAVFYDFPYLYEGDMDYEKEYLKVYSQSSRSFVHAVYDGNRMIGATTCIPLSDETEEVKSPFIDAGLDPGHYFYFGESILLAPYRGRGLGHLFFDERERHAQSFGDYSYACFCSVERPDDHPLLPEGYRPNDKFWKHRGYVPFDGLSSQFEWQDRGEEKPTLKKMNYWIKAL